MFFANVPFEYLDVTAHTALSDKFPGSFGNLTAQHLVAVLRHPYEVVLDVVNRVCARSILCHQSVIVAAPAKAVRLKAKVLDLARGNKVSYGVLVYFRKLPHFRNGFREHFGHNALYEVSQLPSLEPVSRF